MLSLARSRYLSLCLLSACLSLLYSPPPPLTVAPLLQFKGSFSFLHSRFYPLLKLVRVRVIACITNTAATAIPCSPASTQHSNQGTAHSFPLPRWRHVPGWAKARACVLWVVYKVLGVAALPWCASLGLSCRLTLVRKEEGKKKGPGKNNRRGFSDNGDYKKRIKKYKQD